MDDAWIILNDVVYDISDFLEDETNHPGGFSLLVEYLGKDISVCSHLFKYNYGLRWQEVFYSDSIHFHSEQALKHLEFYRIGSLKE